MSEIKDRGYANPNVLVSTVWDVFVPLVQYKMLPSRFSMQHIPFQ